MSIVHENVRLIRFRDWYLFHRMLLNLLNKINCIKLKVNHLCTRKLFVFCTSLYYKAFWHDIGIRKKDKRDLWEKKNLKEWTCAQYTYIHYIQTTNCN